MVNSVTGHASLIGGARAPESRWARPLALFLLADPLADVSLDIRARCIHAILRFPVE